MRDRLKTESSSRLLIVFGAILVVNYLMSGCSPAQADLQRRIYELEQRVNTLEAAVAKSQGSEIYSPTISSESPKGLMTLPSSKDGKSNSSGVRKTPESYQTYSGRCEATTKAGKQCKRKAQPGFAYCWQH